MLFPSVGETLARMVANGLCTLEDLDKPSSGWAEAERSRVSSQNPCDFTDPYQRVPVKVGDEMHYSYPRPTMKYGAAEPYRNLARDWIAANPKRWAEMTGETSSPAVQLSEPRDFTPTEGTTPAQPLDLPLTPEELDW